MMPRYRFRWELVPPALIRRLAARIDVAGDPVAGLRSRYGARPSLGFVQEQWPVLRESWLASDSTARKSVVAELQARRLGNWQAATSRHADQQAYLASCRNSVTLRQVVLDAFLLKGDIGQAGPEARRASTTQHTPPRVVRPPGDTDVEKAAEVAWHNFEHRLARAVEMLGENQFLIVEATPRADEDQLEEAAPFVQFAGQGTAGMRAEASSNESLDERFRLSPEQEARLLSLGWLPPSGSLTESTPEHDPSGSPNYFRDFPAPVSGDGVARMAVATLSTVFAVPHPSFLRAGGFAGQGAHSGPEVDLGVPPLETQGQGPPPLEPLLPQSATELQRMVDATLAPRFGGKVAHDDDGAIPVRAGSAIVFILVADDAPVVSMLSPVLLDVDESPALMRRLVELNGHLRFARLHWQNRTVLASLQLMARPFVPEHLNTALDVMSSVADAFDEQLQTEFGGKPFFGEFRPPPSQDEGTGGYL